LTSIKAWLPEAQTRSAGAQILATSWGLSLQGGAQDGPGANRAMMEVPFASVDTSILRIHKSGPVGSITLFISGTNRIRTVDINAI
jgi:hypothetical protein